MGIFGALINSVSGLKAQSYALENISGNIANSQTTGFKRTETAFSDLVADAVPAQQIAGGVLAYSRSTNTVQGDIQNASVDTFMAINGEGFFVVQRPGNFVDGRPIFEGVDLYTRRGDFQLDRDGFLVNGAGYYLKALRVDPTTGNISGSVPEVIQFQNDFLPARVTSEIEYRANLATYPITSASDPSVPGSELISLANYSNNPIARTDEAAKATGTGATLSGATDLITQGAVTAGQTLTIQVGTGAVQTITFGTGAGEVDTLAELSTALGTITGATAAVDATGNITVTGSNLTDSITIGGSASVANFGLTARTVYPSLGGVIGQDVSTFLDQSVSGGAVTAYDVNGSPVNVQMRWVKESSSAYGGQDVWSLFYQESSTATGSEIAWRRVPQDYVFDAAGQLSPSFSTVAISGVTINGVAVGDITLNHGVNGLTQFADPNGNVSVTKVQQNGYPAGDLIDIAVSEGGRIIANYSNGRSAEIAEIPLYSFYGTNFLKKLDGGAFAQTSESGPPIADASGGIIGKALEGSNTDIADEFTKLIVTQQAYAANTRVVTTANDMLREVLQMSR